MAEIKSIHPPVADLGAEIDRLHTVEALLKGAATIADDEGMNDIKRICKVACERLEAVRNSLDLIGMGRGAEVQHG